MKKLQMVEQADISFEEGCEKYILDCKRRNLRDGTISHYRHSYRQFYKYIEPDLPLADFTKLTFDGFVLNLREKLDNDISINSYLRDLITTLRFLMSEGYMREFEMKGIKVDKHNIETYTEQELRMLLKKPDLKKCKFIEYQSWVMTNFLFCTGVRQRSLEHIQVRDIDFENAIVNIRVTKNRKPLIIPINTTMLGILREFLKHRQHKDDSDWLFCNVYGQQLVKSTSYHMLSAYNKNRGVEKTGIHRYRHTFAKQWIVNGGNVVTLSRLLGHSNLAITQNYIHLLVSDLAKQVDEINLLEIFQSKQCIRMKNTSR